VRRTVVAALIVGFVPVAGPGNAWGDPVRGERVFQRCYSCHSVIEGETNLQGPNLRGVIGRRAGTLPGFEYSEPFANAVRERRLVWTRQTLEAYLADPEAFIAGTAMTQNLPGADDRRDVIDFLEAAGR
jgi:cytochrome c